MTRPRAAGRAGRRIGALLFSGGLLAACGDPVAPGEPTFRLEQREVFGAPHVPTLVEGLDRAIRITGLLIAPGTEYTVQGELKVLAPRELEVELTATATSAGLPYLKESYYVGTIERLSRGEYTLRVFHIIAATPADTVMTFNNIVRVR